MAYSPTIVLFVILSPPASKPDSKQHFFNSVAIFLMPGTVIYGSRAIDKHLWTDLFPHSAATLPLPRPTEVLPAKGILKSGLLGLPQNRRETAHSGLPPEHSL